MRAAFPRGECNRLFDPALVSSGGLDATFEENDVNKDTIKGNWKQLTGSAKEQWGKLTDDDLTVIEGKRDQLVGRIQERYGIARDEAAAQVDRWESKL
jgi:uncharacterized protein YjbJ (UPF0337 family)